MKILVGVDAGTYTFNAVAKTITLNGLTPVAIEHVLLITNIERAAVIYQFNSNQLGGTISGNVITLDYDTTQQLSTDPLQIFIDYKITTASGGGLTDTQLRATPVPVTSLIPALAISKKSVELTLLGDTTIHTPATGKRIRLFSFGYSASGTLDTGNVKTRWRFGVGSYKDTQFLTGNQGYAKSPGNGKFYYEGGIDESLIVNLGIAANVAVNIDYDEQ